jgi:Spy/CpxP family protein refolding chaperone
MRAIQMSIVAALLALASVAHAQQPGSQPQSDPIGENLFPPELVMQHQQQIGLTEEQRSFIIVQVGNAQQRATELTWKLQREVETMAALVKQEPIDEEKMLAQLDRVLAAERDIKRLQLTLVARIKNKLTPKQCARLRELRAGAPR